MNKNEAIGAIQSGAKVWHPNLGQDGYFAIMDGRSILCDGGNVWHPDKTIMELLQPFSSDDHRFMVITRCA